MGHHAGGVDDGGQGIAQLVAQHGQKFILGAVLLFGHGARFVLALEHDFAFGFGLQARMLFRADHARRRGDGGLQFIHLDHARHLRWSQRLVVFQRVGGPGCISN